ncbi:xylose isomerase-like protein [Echria macrotheca]|uniref:Xylose isomerase-like protein n=1 Tax=Echria macrotheca TaxID=438768 RepID=A0AAJ0F2W4_9PEZI|nr:xylose isomerase-like protein [Echria macrotheca]
MPVAFASCSIGSPKHTLHQKIEAITQNKFTGIELSFPDLISYANQHFGREIAEDDYPSLCEAATLVRHLCESHNLQILVLQPFSNFEGHPRDSPAREDAFARARGWIRIMEAAGTKMLQVGSSDTPDDAMTADRDMLAADLAELADMLAEHGFRLAYENWCWATRAPRWRDVWDIVQRTNRSNVGLCLDTFQTAGGEWGDPTTEDGRAAGWERYTTSLKDLAGTVPADRIFFVQISDAYPMQPPLDAAPDPETGLRPRGRWSHDYRPLPYDGGYLPIRQFVEAVLATGYRGWWSIEVFDSRAGEKYGGDLFKFAAKARESYRKLMGDAMLSEAVSGAGLWLGAYSGKRSTTAAARLRP